MGTMSGRPPGVGQAWEAVLKPAEVAVQCVQVADHRNARGVGFGTAGVAQAVADYTLAAGGKGRGGGTLASRHRLRSLLLLEVAGSEGGGCHTHRLSFGRPIKHNVRSSFVGG